MNRIRLSLALTLTLLAAIGIRTAEASSPLDAETMRVALHASTDEENGFIDYVLALVDNGTLPLDMVESTFLWAKKKPRHQFQHFKQGLILRAEQAGISI